MNAKELAKEAKERFLRGSIYEEIALTLIEQADRIAELETFLKDMDAKLSDAVLRYWQGDFIISEQADRIAELEKALTQYRIENFIEGEYGQTITLAELRKTELYNNVRKQLTKPFQNPVAWCLTDTTNNYIRSIMAVKHDFVPENCIEIPLYTHPVKQLSDEKINNWAVKFYEARTGAEIHACVRAIIKEITE